MTTDKCRWFGVGGVAAIKWNGVEWDWVKIKWLRFDWHDMCQVLRGRITYTHTHSKFAKIEFIMKVKQWIWIFGTKIIYKWLLICSTVPECVSHAAYSLLFWSISQQHRQLMPNNIIISIILSLSFVWHTFSACVFVKPCRILCICVHVLAQARFPLFISLSHSRSPARSILHTPSPIFHYLYRYFFLSLL